MAPDVLELSALSNIDRPQARLKWDDCPEGELFDLLTPEDMNAIDMARLSRMFSDHDELWEKDSRTKAEDTKLVKLLDDLTAKLIIDAPAKAVKALPAVTKRGLAVRFFVQAGMFMAPTLAGIPGVASLQENSSQD